MPLATGTRLGPYEIIAAIGAGGMGEVYRAKDTNLDRDVAIKVMYRTRLWCWTTMCGESGRWQRWWR